MHWSNWFSTIYTQQFHTYFYRNTYYNSIVAIWVMTRKRARTLYKQLTDFERDLIIRLDEVGLIFREIARRLSLSTVLESVDGLSRQSTQGGFIRSISIFGTNNHYFAKICWWFILNCNQCIYIRIYVHKLYRLLQRPTIDFKQFEDINRCRTNGISPLHRFYFKNSLIASLDDRNCQCIARSLNHETLIRSRIVTE